MALMVFQDMKSIVRAIQIELLTKLKRYQMNLDFASIAVKNVKI